MGASACCHAHPKQATFYELDVTLWLCTNVFWKVLQKLEFFLDSHFLLFTTWFVQQLQTTTMSNVFYKDLVVF